MTVNTFAAKLHNIKNAIFGVKNNPKIGKYIAFGLILLLMILGSAIVFPAVAAFLYGIALLTGLTYNEINIIVYYFVIPFSWLWMLDKYFRFHWLKIAFLLFCIVFFVVCEDFLIFSNDLFNKSVAFLEWFRRFNMDYIVSSVVICVIAPIMIYAVLAVLLHRRKKRDAADEPKKSNGDTRTLSSNLIKMKRIFHEFKILRMLHRSSFTVHSLIL